MKKILILPLLAGITLLSAAPSGAKVTVYEIPYGVINQDNQDNMDKLYRTLQDTTPTKVYRAGPGKKTYTMSKKGVTVTMSDPGARDKNFDALLDLVAAYASKYKTSNKVGIVKTLKQLKKY